MKRISSAYLMVMVVLCASVTWGYAQRPTRDSTWERLLQADPSVADDPSIGWRERLILNVLSPEQAGAYFEQGADPQSLLLENGLTLQEYLDAKLSPPASVYIGLPVPCALFSSDSIEPTARYNLRVRGQDLRAQGGSATGAESRTRPRPSS